MSRSLDRAKKSLPRVNYAVLIGTAVLIVALIVAGIRQARPSWHRYTGSAQVRILTPTLTGEPELCLTCHYGIQEISVAHQVDAFGCVVCHGGDRLSLDEETAHQDLIGGRNPSDLAVVQQGCGSSDCHGGSPEDARDHIARVERNVRTTYAGAINQVLLSLNQIDEGDLLYGVEAVEDGDPVHPEAVAALQTFDPADFDNPLITTFGEDCQTCHLRAEPVDEPYHYRSVGCATCHVLYNSTGLYTGDDPTIPHDEAGHMAQHRLTTQIPFTQCNTCHNRGNYSVEQMSFTPRDDVPSPHALPSDPTKYRLAQYYQPTTLYALCEWELDCIDCHTAREVMGDGDIHPNQASAQSVQCRTCHGTPDELPTFVTVTDTDNPTVRRADLNPYYDVIVGTQVLLAPDGDTLGAVQLVGDQVVQIGKVTGRRFIIPMVMGSDCPQDPEQQEAYYCRQCHAVNASQ